ncbi:MAG: hypothetical protein SVM79_06350, partial [Chloroflexota bacterium]|nr:hypothetical protein [Chloroflexota bacterium]
MSFVFRIIGAILFGVGGRQLGLLIIERSPQIEELSLVIPLTVCSTILGFVFIPYPAQWLQNKIRQVPGHVLAAAVIGLVIALGVSALSALPLSLLPGLWGKFTPLVFCVIVIYLGVLIMAAKNHDQHT